MGFLALLFFKSPHHVIEYSMGTREWLKLPDSNKYYFIIHVKSHLGELLTINTIETKIS